MAAKEIRSCIIVLAALAVSCVSPPPPAPSPSEGPPTAPILRLELGMHSSTGEQVGTDAEGRYVLTSSVDKTARLWDASSGQLLRVYRVPSEAGSSNGFLYSCALSPDARIAVMGGLDWENSLYVFDRHGGELLKRMSGMRNVPFRLQFTADGAYLAAVLGGKGGCMVWRCRDWALVGEDAEVGDSSYGLDLVQRDGSWVMATGSNDGKIRFYNLRETLEKLFEYDAGAGRLPAGLSFSPDGNFLAVGYKDSCLVQVFSVSSTGIARAYAPDVSKCPAVSLTAVCFSRDGKSLYAGGNWSANGATMMRVWDAAGAGPCQDVRTGGTDATNTIEPLPAGGVLIGGTDPYWGVLDASREITMKMDAPIIAFWRKDVFRIAPDGRAVSFNSNEARGSPLCFDASTRSLVSRSPASDWQPPDTTSLKIEGWRGGYAPRLDQSPLAITKGEYASALAIAPGARKFVLGTYWNIYCFTREGKQLWKTALPDIAWNVNISHDGRVAVAAIGDGTIRWYRLSDGREILSLFSHPDGKRWVLWTPSGYYDASPGGEELIGWQVNNGMNAPADFFPAARFRATYYRPDVISLALTTLDEGRALTLAGSKAGRQREPGSILDRRPPIVTITSPETGSAISAGTLKLSYSVRTSPDAPMTAVRALIDGRPAENVRGLAIVNVSAAEQDIELKLPARDCTVSVIAENKNGPSEAASISLLWNGAATAQDEFVAKPMLFILAVGVSEYQNPDYRLKYASKDARDFTAFLGRGGALYRGVKVMLLADAQATKVGILDGLEWIQRQTTSRDIAMLLFAGHGINDATGNYYFLPVEADIDRLKATCVPFSDIKTTVSSLAGKVLIFIDTCHSGNLMAGRRAADAARDVVGIINELASTENGAVVFASSTGNQYSYEDPAWGNGAFTKASVEGLAGAAAYGRDGRVTVNMLDLYLAERVKALTGGKQTPTTTKPPNVPDFTITLVAPTGDAAGP